MEVIEILTQELVVLEKLIEVISRENELLSKSPSQSFYEMMEQKRELSQCLSDLESQRLVLMGDLSLKEFEKECEVNISDLVASYDRVMKTLTHLVETNKELIKMNVDYCQEVVQLISRSTTEKVNTYGKQGVINSTEIQTKSLINRKV